MHSSTEDASGWDGQVLTTYAMIELEAEGAQRKAVHRIILKRIKWRRIVLDECQNVRASTTTLAKACEALEAPRRWMVTSLCFGRLRSLLKTPIDCNDPHWNYGY